MPLDVVRRNRHMGMWHEKLRTGVAGDGVRVVPRMVFTGEGETPFQP
jgi:hypothetical protein